MKVFSSTEDKKKFGTFRTIGAVSLLVILLFFDFERPVNGMFVPGTELGVGVLGFLRSLEITLEQKTSWFYRYFGQNVDPAKINRAKDCDYGNSFNIKFCPPAFATNAPSQNPNMASGLSSHNTEHLSKENRDLFLSIPSKCLEDPDDPECRSLRTLADNALPGIGQNQQIPPTQTSDTDTDAGGIEGVPSPAPNPNHAFLTEPPSAPSGATATFSPTRNMCYGNHDSFKQAGSRNDEMTNVRGKWCESSMPSVSLEPSASPTIYPEGRQDGNETPTKPTPKPSAVIEQPVLPPVPRQKATEEPTIGDDWEGPPVGMGRKEPTLPPRTQPISQTVSQTVRAPSGMPVGQPVMNPQPSLQPADRKSVV